MEASKVLTVECDSEIFFNETDILKGCIHLDYDDLEYDYPSIFNELKRTNPYELEQLKNKEVDYLAVYSSYC
jgi:hypothetical protein